MSPLLTTECEDRAILKQNSQKETLSKISSQDFPLIDIADDKEGGKVTDDSGRAIPDPSSLPRH